MNRQQRRADYAHIRKSVLIGMGNKGPIFGARGSKTGSNRSRPLNRRTSRGAN